MIHARHAPTISADSHVEVDPAAWCDAALLRELTKAIQEAHWTSLIQRSHLGSVVWRPGGGLPGIEADGDDQVWTPQRRIDDMDLDGVDAEVLYPPLLFDLIGGLDIPRELSVTLAQSYNDWLSGSYCAKCPGRLWGLATVPASGADDAIVEMRRSAELPGLVGVTLQQWPNGSGRPGHGDDEFWDVAANLEIPLTFHIGLGGGLMAERIHEQTPAAYMLAPFGGHTEYVVAQLVCCGVFDRHPQLRVAAGETGIGWLPYFLEQMDLNFERYRWSSHCRGLKARPSEYVSHNLLFVIQEDQAGLSNCDSSILKHTMWGSDYPHTVSNWPASQELLEIQLESLPADLQRAIRSETARQFYGQPDLTEAA